MTTTQETTERTIERLSGDLDDWQYNLAAARRFGNVSDCEEARRAIARLTAQINGLCAQVRRSA